MKENAIELKTKSFAVRIIRLYQFLVTEKREFVLSKQLLRQGPASEQMSVKAHKDLAGTILYTK